MRYYKKDSQEFVQNGLSLVRVESLAIVGDIYNPGRMGRIMAVKEVKRSNDKNPIFPGSQFCLSFPPHKINAPDYTWSANEPKQIPLKMKKVNRPLEAQEQVVAKE